MGEDVLLQLSNRVIIARGFSILNKMSNEEKTNPRLPHGSRGRFLGRI